jgi:hypothetical protein
MSKQSSSESKSLASAGRIPESATLPDAPLSMPVQSLDPFAPLAFLRVLFSGANRIVKD